MPEQHDDHCVMNVNWKPWRIQWIHNGQMAIANKDGQTRVADLSVLNWEKYCDNAAAWLEEESARLARTEAFRAAERADDARWEREEASRNKERAERELERCRREWQQAIRQSIGYAQLLASGYGLIEDLEDEVVLVNLEFTDPEPILAFDCQTTHLERLAA